MEAKTIKTLEDLTKIDYGQFLEMTNISFDLPNGDFINRRAEKIAAKILQDKSVDLLPYKSLGGDILEIVDYWIEHFEDSFFNRIKFTLVTPSLPLSIVMYSFVFKAEKRKIQQDAYKNFLNLREKIGEAYRNAEILNEPYRGSPPIL